MFIIKVTFFCRNGPSDTKLWEPIGVHQQQTYYGYTEFLWAIGWWISPPIQPGTFIFRMVFGRFFPVANGFERLQLVFFFIIIYFHVGCQGSEVSSDPATVCWTGRRLREAEVLQAPWSCAPLVKRYVLYINIISYTMVRRWIYRKS